MLNGLIGVFRQEWAVIKQAPLTFFLSLLVISIAIGAIEYATFKEALARKNDLIDTLTKQQAAKPAPTIPVTATPTKAPEPTGSATASGTGNVANTGNSSKINNNVQSTPPQKSKPHH
jgi:hypothetical protein